MTSDYIFDASRSEYRHIHKVNWTHKGEWDHDGQIVMKTITDITPYTDYYKQMEDMFFEDSDPGDDPAEYDKYTKDDFLDDVYIRRNNTSR